MDQFDLITYLTQWGPTVVVLGLGYWIMYGMYKQERNENTSLQEYIRKTDHKNLELLQEFSTLLDNIMSTSESNKEDIKRAINDDARDIKEHISSLITLLHSKPD